MDVIQRNWLTAYVFIYTALAMWISDDALIVLRQVQNFIDGHGIVFNLGQRVQAFTSTAWFFLVSLITAILSNTYVVWLLICAGLSAVSIYFALRILRFSTCGIVIFSLILASRSVRDYTASMLENPLEYCAFTLWFYGLFRLGHRSILLIAAGSLLALTRPEYVPIAFLTLWMHRLDIKASVKVAAGVFLVLCAWHSFALFYFGHFLPLPALAKLGTSIPNIEYIEKGLYHLLDWVIDFDPIAALLILAASISAIAITNRQALTIYLCAIILVAIHTFEGQDFMHGRHMATPTFLAGLSLAMYHNEREILFRKYLLAPWIVLIVPAILYYGYHSTGNPNDAHGRYWDERLLNFTGTNWVKHYAANGNFQLLPKVFSFTDEAPSNAMPICGGLGHAATRDILHFRLIDPCALTDPYLARIPEIQGPWQIGHLTRNLPYGYIRSFSIDKNVIANNDASKLYEEVMYMTSGELWSLKRIRVIFSQLFNANNMEFDTTNIVPGYNPIIEQRYLPIATVEHCEYIALDAIPIDGMKYLLPETCIFDGIPEVHLIGKTGFYLTFWMGDTPFESILFANVWNWDTNNNDIQSSFGRWAGAVRFYNLPITSIDVVPLTFDNSEKLSLRLTMQADL